MMIKIKNNLVIISHVNFLFDHMLVNSLVHTNLLSITSRHDELFKFLV